MPEHRKKAKGRKIGRGARKKAHLRYTAQDRRTLHKRRNVERSSHGKCRYDAALRRIVKLSKPREEDQ